MGPKLHQQKNLGVSSTPKSPDKNRHCQTFHFEGWKSPEHEQLRKRHGRMAPMISAPSAALLCPDDASTNLGSASYCLLLVTRERRQSAGPRLGQTWAGEAFMSPSLSPFNRSCRPRAGTNAYSGARYRPAGMMPSLLGENPSVPHPPSFFGFSHPPSFFGFSHPPSFFGFSHPPSFFGFSVNFPCDGEPTPPSTSHLYFFQHLLKTMGPARPAKSKCSKVGSRGDVGSTLYHSRGRCKVLGRRPSDGHDKDSGRALTTEEITWQASP